MREMYLNIDAIAMHEPGTVNCTSCSCRPGLFYRALLRLAHTGSQ